MDLIEQRMNNSNPLILSTSDSSFKSIFNNHLEQDQFHSREQESSSKSPTQPKDDGSKEVNYSLINQNFPSFSLIQSHFS